MAGEGAGEVEVGLEEVEGSMRYCTSNIVTGQPCRINRSKKLSGSPYPY